MKNTFYLDELKKLLLKNFVPSGFIITKDIEEDSVPENAKYDALNLAINNKKVVYRKGNVTPDRPGAFLAIWKRPTSENDNGNKPVPLQATDLDYLLVQVENHSPSKDNRDISHMENTFDAPKRGMFIFPVSLLIQKGIVTDYAVLGSETKGKTGFRVFPPWSQDRGNVGTKIFSESGKKTQKWQLPYFIEISEQHLIDHDKLTYLLK